jgi:phage terminase Nu1 subunit (DNA packaging protein)
MNHEVLNSWKEIAAYLGRGVRTVQRWEQELGLPVRRPRGRERSAVIALKTDLDLWLQSAPSGALAKENEPLPHHLQLRHNTRLLKLRTAELLAQSQTLKVRIEKSFALAAQLSRKRPPQLQRRSPAATVVTGSPGEQPSGVGRAAGS